MSRLKVWAWLLLLLGLASGCGDGLPASVTGTITVDGNALTRGAGEVMFHPSGGGAMAMASLQADGTYEITTGSTSGLEPGSYQVTVRVVEIQPVPPGSQNPPGQKPVTPSRYSNKDSSGLTAEVAEGKNVFDFDLQSK